MSTTPDSRTTEQAAASAIPDGDQPSVMDHPGEQPQGTEGMPRFGLLLIILVAVVVLLGGLTWLMVTLYE